MLAKVFF